LLPSFRGRDTKSKTRRRAQSISTSSPLQWHSKSIETLMISDFQALKPLSCFGITPMRFRHRNLPQPPRKGDADPLRLGFVFNTTLIPQEIGESFGG